MNLVVMGVSGCGKSTFARQLSEAIAATFIEGDELHPPSNVAKMSAGIPLQDSDRQEWLETIRDLLAAPSPTHRVFTCSALKRKYRDLLRTGDPEVRFLHLTAPREVLEARMRSRDHFMPAALLESQLRDLEAPANALTLSTLETVEELVRQARRELGI